MPVENVKSRRLFHMGIEFPARNLSLLPTFLAYRIQNAGRLSMPQAMRPVGVIEETLGVVDETVLEPSVAGVSWAAVAAGAVASCALTLVLLSLGAGLGFSVVSPWANSGVSATTFQIGTGLYFIVMAMISSAAGGYLAGRLRNRWIGVASTEVVFRDTAHGFLAWALASVLGAILLASPATSLLSSSTSGATQAMSSPQATGPMDGYVDALLRPENPTTTNSANADSSDTRRELARLLTADFRSAEPSTADRSYIAKMVAARTGLNPADADKRVSDVITQIKSDLDKARKAAEHLAIWLTLSLFIGAFSAALAATEGGGLRDGTWGKTALRP
jgi:hypothetical protein